MNTKLCSCVAASAVLVGVGVAPVAPGETPAIASFNVQLTAGEKDVFIDFVRHAETNPTGAEVAVASNGLPGYPLNALGETQASAVGTDIFGKFGSQIAGLFGGQEQRMGATAAPLEQLLGMTMQNEPAGLSNEGGFNEIGGGVYVHDVPGSPGAIMYLLTEAAWAFGLRFVPLPGSNDYNGMQFEENFGGAVDAMYNQTVTDAPDSATNMPTDVVFSGGAAIATWVLMNVKNPDLPQLLPLFLASVEGGGDSFLPPTGQVEIEGNPTDGWTLVSFNGIAMPETPDLLTELFVDVRNLITVPQQAAWDFLQALLNGGTAPEAAATVLQDGLQSIGTAMAQFPESVITDIMNALSVSG